MDINAVVFDLGGVLVDWNPRHLYRALFAGDEEAMEHFLATVCTPAWNAEQDRGRSFRDAVAMLQREHPHQADLIAAYFDRWGEMLRGTIAESVGILEELHAAAVPVFALTNWSAETFPLALERFSFLNLFQGVIVSGEEGVIKPDPRIFCLLVDRFGLAPDRTLFVDDVAANVEGALRLGFQAVRFTSPARLREELVERGLLRPARTE
jgi:2-haloacid dehalogenase